MRKKKQNRPVPSATLDAEGLHSVALFPDAVQEDALVFDPSAVPLLPLTDQVPFPHVPLAIKIDEETSLEILEKAFMQGDAVFAVARLPEAPAGSNRMTDYGAYGTVCKVAKIIKFPGVPTGVFLLPGPRAHFQRFATRKPPLKIRLDIDELPLEVPPRERRDTDQLIEELKKAYARFLDFLGDEEKDKIKCAISAENQDDWYALASFMANNSPMDVMQRTHILSADSPREFLETTLRYLGNAIQKFEIKASILERTHQEITENQRRAFLQQQLQSIQEELGNANPGPPNEQDDFNELSQRSMSKTWNPEAQEHFDRELAKLSRFNPSSPEYSIQYSYLDTLLNLPWLDCSDSDFTVEKVENKLNEDHFGLEKVKERILEHMAVLKLRNDLKAPILCLVGPPGVGKTSLGASIAKALGREYARISLGGVHDEAEIRGHRRTYVGAMPGRIINALEKCGKGNPVIVLDEIDKINTGLKGDPSTALLEVLDPEQNNKFHDNYLNIGYDLSDVLFIATANSLSTVSRPLLDRMEVIEVTGYIPQEKIEIARRHLVPKNLLAHGFKPGEVEFSEEALREIIDRYTRESGVRGLEKKIAAILRRIALAKASGKEFPAIVTADDADAILGKAQVVHDLYDGDSLPGVVTGLAWTETGGEILAIETSLYKGNGDKLTLTGNLGDVMKESAAIALQYLRANGPQSGISDELLSSRNVHIHVPEGAVPKDGPSAGITILTSLASAFTGKQAKQRLAMTGEMTLRGKVLPVGGIKEKILAAKRAGITDIILSVRNKPDIEEIKPVYIEDLTFHYVSTADEVLELALV